MKLGDETGSEPVYEVRSICEAPRVSNAIVSRLGVSFDYESIIVYGGILVREIIKSYNIY